MTVRDRRAVVWSVVVAAGSGERFGGDKQAADLAGQPVVVRAVRAATSVSDGVVVVATADRRSAVVDLLAGLDGVEAIVNGGDTRSASVRCGLAAVPADAEVVLVHDGARPLATPDLFRRVVEAVCLGAEAVVPGIPLADSLRSVEGRVIDRDGVIAVQTPQGFAAEALRRAHADGGEASDDATLVEATGVTVVVVEGEPANLKVTRPMDLALAVLEVTSAAEQSTDA
ncbi:MAG: 2-C-methyl-D-erythritol 4-phosphate cytidylyltransferase [Acidimicrobiaceae bacterium]|nr:2-C-methyl-D-erythritol 4-phosphate cytidylyltransferase [Acidimicrobiaceae bacterium]|tara:strand:+ start:772 stop:1455 length:684 start_codon:yes stop_codon:yes gene_type:complete